MGIRGRVKGGEGLRVGMGKGKGVEDGKRG